MNSQACKNAISHAFNVHMTHELQHGAACRKQVRIWRPSSLCRRALNNIWNSSPREPRNTARKGFTGTGSRW